MTLHSWQALGRVCVVGLAALAAATETPVIGAPTASVKDTLAFTPKQQDVEYETPKPEEFAKCKVEAERKGKASGWVVLGPAGQILRKIIDTDGDGTLDQWRYYNQGVEVYRDIDSNNNGKIDQSRWVNLGGSRWGIDQNEDGKIDAWKTLSASEASKEAIRAMVSGDDAALQLVMVNAEDLKSIGLNQQLATKLLESATDVGKKSRAIVSKSRVLAQSRWVRFDALMPSTIPLDDEKATGDLQAYENAMAIVESQGKFIGVQIGEVVRIGEVWKLTQVPQPIEGDGTHVSAGGTLIQPLLAVAGTGTNPGTSPEVEKLLVDLQKIESTMMQPNVDKATVKSLMARRADLLRRAIDLADTDDEKLLLTKQMVDGYALAAQMGTFPEGAADLRAMEVDLRRRTPKSPLVPYVAYRRIQAQYYVDMTAAEKDKAADVQKEWIKGMEDFLKEFPESEDGADAMLLLAHHEELSGKAKEAAEWYQRLMKERPKTDAGIRAVGALRRLDLTGKALVLNGPGFEGGTIDIRSYKGKTVLVVFWSSEYRICEEDLPQLRALYQDNKARGFEIVGVCLDSQKETIKPFLTQHRMTWPQLYQPGGLNAPAAINYGIASLPTMFLVNGDGIVVNRSATVQDVNTALKKVVAGK